MRNHDTWVSCSWSDRRDKHFSEVAHLMETRTLFLQKFGSLTTKRLQLIRKNESKPSIRKADISNDEVERLLLARARPTHDFLWEVLRLETSDTSGYLRRMLKVDDDFSLTGLTAGQEAVLINGLYQLGLDSDPIYETIRAKEEIPITQEMKKQALDEIYPRLETVEKPNAFAVLANVKGKEPPRDTNKGPGKGKERA